MEFAKLLMNAYDLMQGDFENVEYLRGICELIAETYPKEDIELGERAVEIAIAIGASKEAAEAMYFLRP